MGELARLQKVFVKNKDNEELTEKDVKDLAANLKRFNAEERDEVTVKMVDPEESATCASLKTEGNEPSWFNWLREIAPCAPSWDPFSRACDHAFVCKEGSVFLDGKGDEDKNCLPFHSDKKFKSKQTVTIDKKKKTRTERITYYDKNEKTTVFDLNMEMKDGIKIDEMKDGIKIEETYTDPQKNTKTTVFDLEGNVVEETYTDPQRIRKLLYLIWRVTWLKKHTLIPKRIRKLLYLIWRVTWLKKRQVLFMGRS